MQPISHGSETELAWAAGFFDGEGSTGCYPHKKPSGKTHMYPHLSIKQNDRELLDRFRSAVGVGQINGPYGDPTRFTDNPFYYYTAYGFEKVQRIRDLLHPFLGFTKRDQFARALVRPLIGSK